MANTWKPLPKVIQWSELCLKWEGLTGCPAALGLATIHQESGGRPQVTRYELDYERRYVLASSKNLAIAKRCSIGTHQMATSYGLMQLMFPLAYGYGARSIDELFDPNQNIRFGMAHLGVLIKKHKTNSGRGETDAASVRAAAGAYNGAGPSSAYARHVSFLYEKYSLFLKGEI